MNTATFTVSGNSISNEARSRKLIIKEAEEGTEERFREDHKEYRIRMRWDEAIHSASLQFRPHCILKLFS